MIHAGFLLKQPIAWLATNPGLLLFLGLLLGSFFSTFVGFRFTFRSSFFLLLFDHFHFTSAWSTSFSSFHGFSNRSRHSQNGNGLVAQNFHSWRRLDVTNMNGLTNLQLAH